MASSTGGVPRAVDLDLQQILQVVFGTDTLVLAQHDHQQEAGADDRQRFGYMVAQHGTIGATSQQINRVASHSSGSSTQKFFNRRSNVSCLPDSAT